MNKIKEIKPVRIIYALKDIFNALDDHIIALERELHSTVQSDHDMTLTINCRQSAIETRKVALEQVRLWINDGIEYMDTETVFSESSLPKYVQSDSICSQIASGCLRPIERNI